MMKQATCIAAVGVLALAGTTIADDLYPPPWRGENRSIYQYWEFGADQRQLSPDGWNHFCPGLTPDQPTANLDSNWVFHDDYAGTGRDGFEGNAADAVLRFDLPNCPDEEPYKLIELQLLWAPGATAVPGIDVVALKNGDNVPFAEVGQIDTITHADDPLVPENFVMTVASFRIEPNPDWEQITMEFSSADFIDQVVIDTISTPEPASLALLGVGGLAVLHRRRRRV